MLATLASEARDRQCPVIIVTGDRDCFQLVEDPYIKVLYNRRGVSDYALYDEAGIVARTGVRPDQYPLLAALRGDPSDNLPGVPGVGEKTAAKLVNQYGSLDALIDDAGSLSPKLRDNLIAYADQVRTNAEIIPLIRDVPLDVAVEDLHLGGWDAERAKQVFAELELRTLWTRVSALMDEGALGPPAGGGALPGGAADRRVRPGGRHRRAGKGGAGTSGAAVQRRRARAGSPSRHGSHRRRADNARARLAGLLEEVRSTTGNLVLAAEWTGAPGRSPLASLTVAAEVEDGVAPGPALHLASTVGSGQSEAWVADPALLADLGQALGPGWRRRRRPRRQGDHAFPAAARRRHHQPRPGHRRRRLPARPLDRQLPPGGSRPAVPRGRGRR